MSETLHLYALVDAPLVHPPPRGAFGERLVQLEASELTAVAGALDEAPPDDRSSALAHAAFVEILARDAAAVLPSRFGTRFGGAGALRAAVDADGDALAAALAAVRGCFEIVLTAVFPIVERPAPESGREYLERRVRESRLVERLVRDVHEPLAARARDARVKHEVAPPRFSASYLVPRQEADRFAAAIDEVTAGDAVEFVRSGPWPPYSFARGEGGA